MLHSSQTVTKHGTDLSWEHLSNLYGVWIRDWTSRMFADLGTLAKKYQMYRTVLFMLQWIKTHPSQSSLSWQTILWPTQTHWASINTISSAAFHLQLCRVHCPGEKVLHCFWSNPTRWWLTNKGTTGNGYNLVLPFLLLLTYRFCLSKLHQRGLVRSISKTRYRLWLQCQWHNKRGESESECLWPSTASVEPWGRDVLNLINRDWITWFTPGRVVCMGFLQHKCFFKGSLRLKLQQLILQENLLVKKQGTAFSCCGLISNRWSKVKMRISVPPQRSYFMTLKTMYTIGYCTSLVTLTIALVVLASLRWGEASLVGFDEDLWSSQQTQTLLVSFTAS